MLLVGSFTVLFYFKADGSLFLGFCMFITMVLVSSLVVSFVFKLMDRFFSVLYAYFYGSSKFFTCFFCF